MNKVLTYNDFLNEGWFSPKKQDNIIVDRILKYLEERFDTNNLRYDWFPRFNGKKMEYKYIIKHSHRSEIDPYGEEDWSDGNKNTIVNIIREEKSDILGDHTNIKRTLSINNVILDDVSNYRFEMLWDVLDKPRKDQEKSDKKLQREKEKDTRMAEKEKKKKVKNRLLNDLDF